MPHVQIERRATARIDKVFRVLVTSDLHGERWYVARNISTTGMFVEMPDPLPLRCKVVVRFCADGSEHASICAMAAVQNHYYLQYADDHGLRALSGVGLRFLRFLPELGGVAADLPTH
ncbi:MAG: pilus assembly protein PilZ [Nannocystaceae bacterium]|nr:pilus assembly protein PilZ [Deltaproteobacteria bacterium]MBK8719874.1 pilus assembly protein PilZ [Deltaproteobacteria bacterium]MBP7291781.1 pilus assembly protein PilZ [Nannocystaceae bacterium]